MNAFSLDIMVINVIAMLTLNSGSALAESASRVRETVDIIELHHCHDFRGRLAFRQLIFYRWSNYHRRFQVVDTLVVTSQAMLPRKGVNGMYQVAWRESGTSRRVQALTLRKSVSSTDPEVPEREYVPVNLRQGLKRDASESVTPAKTEIRTSSRILPERQFKF